MSDIHPGDDDLFRNELHRRYGPPDDGIVHERGDKRVSRILGIRRRPAVPDLAPGWADLDLDTLRDLAQLYHDLALRARHGGYVIEHLRATRFHGTITAML